MTEQGNRIEDGMPMSVRGEDGEPKPDASRLGWIERGSACRGGCGKHPEALVIIERVQIESAPDQEMFIAKMREPHHRALEALGDLCEDCQKKQGVA